MVLGSTQSLTETSTRLFLGDKGGRCVRLTTLPPSCAVVMQSGNLNFQEPSGPLEACNGTALPLSDPWKGLWSLSFMINPPLRIIFKCVLKLTFRLRVILIGYVLGAENFKADIKVLIS